MKMMNFELSDEVIQHGMSVGQRKYESLTGIEPMTFRTHGDTPAMCLGDHGRDSCQGLRYFLCPTLMQ